MTRNPKTGPDFTQAETYMREQTPSIPDRVRTEAADPADDVQHSHSHRRSTPFVIAAVFLLVGVILIYLSDRYGPLVDAVAGVLAAFAIAATIHILQPRPILRFLLVVIALACLSVTFATVLHLHLHGAM